jgi:hypothetical protein
MLWLTSWKYHHQHLQLYTVNSISSLILEPPWQPATWLSRTSLPGASASLGAALHRRSLRSRNPQSLFRRPKSHLSRLPLLPPPPLWLPDLLQPQSSLPRPRPRLLLLLRLPPGSRQPSQRHPRPQWGEAVRERHHSISKPR